MSSFAINNLDVWTIMFQYDSGIIAFLPSRPVNLGLNQAWDLNTARELDIIYIKLLSLHETNNRMGFAKKR